MRKPRDYSSAVPPLPPWAPSPQASFRSLHNKGENWNDLLGPANTNICACFAGNRMPSKNLFVFLFCFICFMFFFLTLLLTCTQRWQMRIVLPESLLSGRVKMQTIKNANALSRHEWIFRIINQSCFLALNSGSIAFRVYEYGRAAGKYFATFSVRTRMKPLENVGM